MKKRFLRLTLCLFTAAIALSGSALAATTGYTTGAVNYDTATGQYSAAYRSAEAGKQYTILVVEGTKDAYTVSDDTIEYIDQQEAAGTQVNFDFIPLSYAAGDKTHSCVVLLTCTGSTAPVVLGTLDGNAAGATVSGTVTLQGRKNHAGVAVTLTDGTATFETVTAADGSFTLDGVADGTYSLIYQKASYLKCTKTLTVEGNAAAAGLQLLMGDVNSDTVVNAFDLQNVQKNFGRTAVTEPVDLNGDTVVNAMDLSGVLKSFGKNSNIAY